MVQLSKSEEKLFNYLVSHKKPVHPKVLANRFLMHERTAASGLRRLHIIGLADRMEVGGKLFYEIKQ